MSTTLGATFQTLITASGHKIKQLFEGKYEMVIVEKAKKLESTIKNITSAVADLGGSIVTGKQIGRASCRERVLRLV